MKWLIVTCVCLAMILTVTANAQQVVINFDELVDGSYLHYLPVGYAGLDWDPAWFWWSWAQPPYNPSSPDTRIATHNYGGYINFPEPVTFDGAYFSGYDYAVMHFEGFLDGSPVGTSASLAPSSTPTWLAANFGGEVDRVEVICASYNQFAMDDFTYTLGELEVEVDIKGGSCPNPFNGKSKGSVPVAIVGSEDLDVTTIDPASICLIGPGGMVCALEGFELEDSTQPGDYAPDECYDCFDADDPANFNCDTDGDGVDDAYCGDTYMDLVVKFDTQELAAAIGAADREDCVELVLIGSTLEGRDITGMDSMVIKTKIKD